MRTSTAGAREHFAAGDVQLKSSLLSRQSFRLLLYRLADSDSRFRSFPWADFLC